MDSYGKRLAGSHPSITFDIVTKPSGNNHRLGSGPIKQRGSVMWDIIIGLFYHRSCRSSLVEMRMHLLAG